MVTRRSDSDSRRLATEERLREALVELESETNALRAKLAEQLAGGRDFLANAAHAIRSPLTVTHSYLEILHGDLSDGLTEEQRSFVDIAFKNVVKLRRLVEDLVDLAALETGTAQVEAETTRIDAAIESAIADILPTAEAKGLNLVSEVAEGLPSATIDENRFRDVLRRLLDNAIRFTPNGGSIEIRTAHDRNHIQVTIQDTGDGIPGNRLGDALRPFVQLHRKAGENRDSYGLGLALCRRQIEAFGGTLDLKSVEGQGTTVTIRIPVPGEK